MIFFKSGLDKNEQFNKQNEQWQTLIMVDLKYWNQGEQLKIVLGWKTSYSFIKIIQFLHKYPIGHF